MYLVARLLPSGFQFYRDRWILVNGSFMWMDSFFLTINFKELTYIVSFIGGGEYALSWTLVRMHTRLYSCIVSMI